MQFREKKQGLVYHSTNGKRGPVLIGCFKRWAILVTVVLIQGGVLRVGHPGLIIRGYGSLCG